MLSERRLEVLRAIVQDYVGTEEPVGSKALTERHNLGVSPATVRNDMAALEDEGYIAQPHTSAGPDPDRQGLPALRRQAGRRQAADRRPSGAPSRTSSTAPSTSTTSSARTVRLLAQLTRQVAVVQYPSLTRSTVRHVELLSLAPARADARADHGHRAGRAAAWSTARRRSARPRSPICGPGSTAGSSGRRFADVPQLVQDLPESFDAEDRGTVSTVLSTLLETLVEETEERLMIGGTANLTRFGHDFPLTIRPVLEAWRSRSCSSSCLARPGIRA